MTDVFTSHWQDWPLARLTELQRLRRANRTDRSREQRVSLVVPARNEAATVGEIVTRLQQTRSLVDEIVVIDSDSTDDTVAVATSAGATVHRARDIRPDLPAAQGKGEAMWKSQFVTTGDLIVFIDADLTEWDTHFVPGLLGPLLAYPDVQLVKGFYRRPGPDDTGVYEGGRVTELVARPMLASLAPELSSLVQPLAGEWAIRRDAFARLSVPTGYGVEVAAVLDVWAAYGIEGLAQVDLGERGHRHQSLHDLGAMAVQVMAAILARTQMPDDETVRLRQFVSDPTAGTGRVEITRDISIAERPGAGEA